MPISFPTGIRIDRWHPAWAQTVVFVRKKVSANKLASALKEEGYSVTNLTGEMDPDLRDQVVEEFRAGKTKASACVRFHVP